MIINSIILKNFKSYEDETTLILKPNDGKNIVLIGGENGAGKSTLFEAIKLCIYGPLINGYLGLNHYYINYIKNVINNNAFSTDIIESYVTLDISINEGFDNSNYVLTRTWNYIDQRLDESFTVYRDGKILVNEELDFFEQYLKSLIPPSIFNYFFFDGEELGSFFKDNNSSTDLYDSVIQLLNYDSFDILRHQLNTCNILLNKNKTELENIQNVYNSALNNYNESLKKYDDLINTKSNLTLKINDLQMEHEKLYDDFKRNGGLLEDERRILTEEISSLENKRSEINNTIRNFCNDKLPFIIMSSFLEKLTQQIETENELVSYDIIKKKLNPIILQTALTKTIKSNLSINDAETISNNILDLLYDSGKFMDSKIILGLSNEQNNYILNMCNEINLKKELMSDEIINNFSEIKEIHEKLKTKRNKLTSASSEDYLNDYLLKNNEINTQISQSQLIIDQIDNEIIELEKEILSKQLTLTKAKNENISLLQSGNISNITNTMQDFIDELLENLTRDKINLIQNEFLHVFKKIIRKENFIDNISIDENFKTTLYVNKKYTYSELLNMIKNIGFKNMTTVYGELFMKDLHEYIEFVSEKDLVQGLSYDYKNETYTIQTKINLNSLSNGEKQIYVLCLIWAIIKVSKVEIPFIIDTPYSRIDTTHRNGLTTYYLPNISKQVIVLSTNEEIDRDLYKTIQPYVSQEYLLIYDTEKRKTTVKNNYFEV